MPHSHWASARAPQAISLAPENHQTWLRDSVCPASSQVQGHSVHLSVEQGCHCFASRSRGPAGEGRDRAGPSSRDEIRVLQPRVHRTQARWWVTTKLGPAHSEPGPSQLLFRMLMQRRIFQCTRPFDYFAANDLKDAYFHVSILPRHRTFLRLAFEGRAYHYKAPPLRAIPVGSCLHQGRGGSPCSVKGSRHSHSQLPRRLAHTGPVSSAVVRTQGLQVNWEKSKLSLAQRISFLSMELDSVNLTARLSLERAQSMLNCLESFQRKRAVPLTHFQRLLGNMASTAAVTLLWLLHMRLLQRWLHDRVPRWAWRHGTYRASVTPSCRRTFRKTLLHERHVLVQTDNTATVAYINHQGALLSCRKSQLARHLLLWSQKHLRSLRAVHVQGELNHAADEISRQPALSGEWWLLPMVVQLIWRRFRDAQVNLFASPDTSHCQLFYSLSEGTFGTDALAVSSTWALARGTSIADICRAAGWVTPNTFARFYNLRIEPVSSHVFVSDSQ